MDWKLCKINQILGIGAETQSLTVLLVNVTSSTGAEVENSGNAASVSINKDARLIIYSLNSFICGKILGILITQ